MHTKDVSATINMWTAVLCTVSLSRENITDALIAHGDKLMREQRRAARQINSSPSDQGQGAAQAAVSRVDNCSEWTTALSGQLL